MRGYRVAIIAVASVGSMLLSSIVNPVAAQDSSSDATYVTGAIVESLGTPPEPVDGSEADLLAMLTEREVDWSDPRLPSRMFTRTLLASREGSHPGGNVWPSITASSYRLEGPDGAWTGVGQGFDVNPEWMPSEPTELMGVEMVTLTGEGGYAGLSAVVLLSVDADEWGAGSYTYEGFIYEGAPPPTPDPIEPGFALPE